MSTRVCASRKFRGYERLFGVVLALLLALPPSCLDAGPVKPASEAGFAHTPPASNWTDAEKWAWSRTESGQPADFDEREKCPPAPPAAPEHQRDRAWDDLCRKLSTDFLQDILTKPPWREAIPFKGVRIAHAKIGGDVDLENVRLVRGISITDSFIDGSMNLNRARTEGLISIQSSLVSGGVQASSLYSESSLLLRWSSFQNVDLHSAKVMGQIDIHGVSVSGALNADSLQTGDFYLQSDDWRQASFKELRLRNAKVAGQIDINSASVSGRLDADGLQTRVLILRSQGRRQSTFQDVILRGANVTGQISMEGVSVSGLLDADGLQTGDLFMRSDDTRQASFNVVSLRSAKVAGDIDMGGATVSGKLEGDALQAGNLYLRSRAPYQATFKMMFLRGAEVAGQIDMNGARVSGALYADTIKARVLFARRAKFDGAIAIISSEISNGLDLRGAEMESLDLRNTSIHGELNLSVAQYPVKWTGSKEMPSMLDLRNAHVGGLVDTKEIWPTDGRLRLALEGLKLDRFGGLQGESGQEMRARGGWWDQWVRLDPDYSPAPYAQLVAVMKAAGDSDAADEIQFLGKERAREAICKRKGLSFNCLLQNVLGFAVGYGIGKYGFRALYWVALISSISMAFLWNFVPEEQRGRKIPVWYLGASLSWLLPGVELSKQFTDFFDGPSKPKFNSWLEGWFWFVRFAGFVLGAALLAAFAGLTHGP
jgi:uncharacterized protein YjbI with pentapeptide repeats